MTLPSWEDRAEELEEVRRALIRQVVDLRTRVAELGSALDRLLKSYRFLLKGTPVRDVAETIAEAEAVLSKGDVMSKRLAEYVRVKQNGDFGWKTSYENEVMGKQWGYAYLAGWYGGMLDELLDTLSPRELDRAISKTTLAAKEG